VRSGGGGLEERRSSVENERPDALNPSNEERGLLGLAFHPGYATNRRLYVFYSAPLRAGAPAGWNHTARISEFTTSGNAEVADAASERVVLEVDQPQSNDNGGTLAFGPDHVLYVSLGDGGVQVRGLSGATPGSPPRARGRPLGHPKGLLDPSAAGRALRRFGSPAGPADRAFVTGPRRPGRPPRRRPCPRCTGLAWRREKQAGG
jgi:hypothetical protein